MRLLLTAGGGQLVADTVLGNRRRGAVCPVDHLVVDREVMEAMWGSIEAHGSDRHMDRLLPIVVVGFLR